MKHVEHICSVNTQTYMCTCVFNESCDIINYISDKKGKCVDGQSVYLVVLMPQAKITSCSQENYEP